MKPQATCKHCEAPIVFEPYYRDGRLPNPPVWVHQPGGRTCQAHEVADDQPWPLAEPQEAQS